MVTEMLEVGIIQPSQSCLYSPVVLAHKKDKKQNLLLVNKKDTFPIIVIYEMLEWNTWSNLLHKYRYSFRISSN